jgi:hypothetical protein
MCKKGEEQLEHLLRSFILHYENSMAAYTTSVRGCPKSEYPQMACKTRSARSRYAVESQPLSVMRCVIKEPALRRRNASG